MAVEYSDTHGVVSYEPSLSFIRNDESVGSVVMVGAVLNGRVSTLKVNGDDTVDLVLKDLDGRSIVYKNMYQGSVVFKDGSPVIRGEILGKTNPDKFTLSVIGKGGVPYITRMQNDKISLAKLNDIKVIKNAKIDTSYAFITQYNTQAVCNLIYADNGLKNDRNDRAYQTYVNQTTSP